MKRNLITWFKAINCKALLVTVAISAFLFLKVNIGYAQNIDDLDTSIPADTSDLGVIRESSKWEYGIAGGFQFSTVAGDKTNSHSYIPGFHAGVFGAVEIFSPLGLMIELYYVGLGTGFASFSDSELHFNYLVLPVMFTYDFRPGFSMGIGPYFGFLLSASDKGDDFEEDISDLIAGLDIGVKLGFYYQISKVVNLGVSFNRGFINTQNGSRNSSFKQYNQSILLTTAINLSRILNKEL